MSGTPADDARDSAVLDAMQRTRAVVPPRLRERFTVRYLCALSLVGVLAVASCLQLSSLVSSQSTAAAQINVSGRQRMLSQRIALEAGLLAGNPAPAQLRVAVGADIDAMESAQRRLLAGDASGLPGHPSPAVAAAYRGGTQAAVDRYVADARQLLGRDVPVGDPAVATLQAQALGPLLTRLDAVVQIYQRESDSRVARLQREEQGVLALTLLTLAVEALCVFRPMSRRIERETRRLEDASVRHRTEAERQAFSVRLREAVDVSDTEPDLVSTVLEAVVAGRVPGDAELLLVRDGAGLVAVPDAAPHACGVAGIDACPALRRGRTMHFPHSLELGACPQLRRDAVARSDEAVASTCVPVTFLGTGIGVLRTVTPAGEPLDERSREALEAIASTAGAHVGTLRAFARSRADAEHDPLTGLLNRRGLEQAVAALEATHRLYVVVVADLDHFKTVNDTYGHDAGDGVLVAASRAMAAVLRPDDVLARQGGEEFVAVLPMDGAGRTPADGLAAGVAVAERLRAAVPGAALPGGPGCTVSLGVAGPVAGGLEDVLRAADGALYRAKAAGRDRVEVVADLVGAIPVQEPQA